MIKKTITYTNIDDQTETKIVYFHLGINQITTLEERHPEGLIKFFQGIVDGSGESSLVRLREVMRLAYGVRHEGSDKLDRDPALVEEFMDSLAYDALWVSLIGDDKAQQEFITGLLPADMMAKARIQVSKQGILDIPEDKPWAKRKPTNEELRTMSREDLLAVMNRDSGEQNES